MTKFLSFFIFSFLFIQCSSSPARFNKTRFTKTEESSLVRVLLDEDLGKKTVSFDIPVLLKDGQEKIKEIAPGETVSFTAEQGLVALKAGRNKYSLKLCDIEPESQEEFLTYNGKSYKGSFSILNAKGKLLLVNSLGLEDYLKGVLYSEMGVASMREDDIEALKAFAVCARNYALMKLRQTGRPFDLYSDVRDQVYGGYYPSRTLISRAVDETAGLVLKYNGELATVFYSSSCGGRTENSDNVFRQKSIPYLKGVNEGEEAFCRIAPGYNWEESYTDKEIVNRLISAGYVKKGEYTLKDIVIKSRYDSGRANELQISLEDSESEPLDVIIIGNKIRYVIRSKTSGNLLKSTMFDLSPVYDGGRLLKVTIKGRGNGHGVGLCQWGAIGQSRKGRKFEDILSFYFPGTVLDEMNQIR
ncbi:MAG TPA: SpoIID/LytB domain-containing protein [Ignavibacteriales bacterium]|nr:SpoIID/LytB domain-containing protein [Ignavibacteriales bacterium]